MFSEIGVDIMKKVIRTSRNVDYSTLIDSIHDYMETGSYGDRLKVIKEADQDFNIQVNSESGDPVGYLVFEDGKFMYQVNNVVSKASNLSTLERALSRFEYAVEVFRDLQFKIRVR